MIRVWLLICLAICASITRVASASDPPPSLVAIHRVTLQDDSIRWDSELFDCRAGASEESTRKVTSTSLTRIGETVRLAPPTFANESIRIISFRDPDLVFVPSDDTSAHRTRHGLEIFRQSPSSREALLQCLHRRSIELAPSAVLLGPETAGGGRVYGRLTRREARARGVLIAASGMFATAVGGLAAAYRQLRRRTRLEASEAILRADMPDF